MKLFIIIFATATTISCAQLNNNYLPPAGASQSGGSGAGLSPPPPRGPSGPSFGGANVPIVPGRPQAPSAPRPPSSAPAAPSAPSGPPIEILSYENVNNGDGSYKWSFESANGIKAEEMGDVKNKGSENAIQTAQGSYSFTSPEGQFIQITYTANENGFEAIGDAIPTPVPLPEANLQAIAEFEAAFATAVPDAGSPSGGSPSAQPQRPGSSAAAGRQGTQPIPSPNRPVAPGSPPKSPSPPASTGFGPAPRPGGGSGNYSPQTGYQY